MRKNKTLKIFRNNKFTNIYFRQTQIIYKSHCYFRNAQNKYFTYKLNNPLGREIKFTYLDKKIL